MFLGVATKRYCSRDCRNSRLKQEREQRRERALAANEKHCGKCGQTLPFSAFRKDRNRLDGHYPWCTDCSREYMGQTKRLPSRWASKQDYDRWCRANRRDQMEDRWFGNYLWTTYRLSEHQYDAILKLQGGRCAICRTTDPGARRGRSNGRFHVDHDHECCPGRNSCGTCVRGLLCFRCNIALGNIRDDPKLLRAAIRYLASPPNIPTANNDDDQLSLDVG